MPADFGRRQTRANLMMRAPRRNPRPPLGTTSPRLRLRRRLQYKRAKATSTTQHPEQEKQEKQEKQRKLPRPHPTKFQRRGPHPQTQVSHRLCSTMAVSSTTPQPYTLHPISSPTTRPRCGVNCRWQRASERAHTDTRRGRTIRRARADAHSEEVPVINAGDASTEGYDPPDSKNGRGAEQRTLSRAAGHADGPGESRTAERERTNLLHEPSWDQGSVLQGHRLWPRPTRYPQGYADIIASQGTTALRDLLVGRAQSLDGAASIEAFQDAAIVERSHSRTRRCGRHAEPGADDAKRLVHPAIAP